MNNEEKILSLMEKMYVEFTDRFEKMDERFDNMDERFDKMDEKLDQKADKTDIIRIENDHGKKLSALFDGYVQNTSKLDRIEKEVTKHEKFILERVNSFS